MTKRRLPEYTPAGFWGSDSSWIMTIESVLDDDETAELIRYAKCNDDWGAVVGQYDWQDRVHRNVTEPNVQDIVDKLTSATKEFLESSYGVSLFDTIPQLNRWRVGDRQPPHADKQELDGSPNCCPNYDLSSIFYLNDDYGGGNIFFPNQNLSLSPKANTLICFPGDVNYLHGVSEVTYGVRYTISVFWTVADLRGER